jgi:hypothetical protein
VNPKQRISEIACTLDLDQALIGTTPKPAVKQLSRAVALAPFTAAPVSGSSWALAQWICERSVASARAFTSKHTPPQGSTPTRTPHPHASTVDLCSHMRTAHPPTHSRADIHSQCTYTQEKEQHIRARPAHQAHPVCSLEWTSTGSTNLCAFFFTRRWRSQHFKNHPDLRTGRQVVPSWPLSAHKHR